MKALCDFVLYLLPLNRTTSVIEDWSDRRKFFYPYVAFLFYILVGELLALLIWPHEYRVNLTALVGLFLSFGCAAILSEVSSPIVASVFKLTKSRKSLGLLQFRFFYLKPAMCSFLVPFFAWRAISGEIYLALAVNICVVCASIYEFVGLWGASFRLAPQARWRHSLEGGLLYLFLFVTGVLALLTHQWMMGLFVGVLAFFSALVRSEALREALKSDFLVKIARPALFILAVTQVLSFFSLFYSFSHYYFDQRYLSTFDEVDKVDCLHAASISTCLMQARQSVWSQDVVPVSEYVATFYVNRNLMAKRALMEIPPGRKLASSPDDPPDRIDVDGIRLVLDFISIVEQIKHPSTWAVLSEANNEGSILQLYAMLVWRTYFIKSFPMGLARAKREMLIRARLPASLKGEIAYYIIKTNDPLLLRVGL